MSLPRSVAAQGERAEALLKEVVARQGNTAQPAPAPTPSPTPTPTPAASPQEPPKEPAPAAAPATPAPAKQPDPEIESLKQSLRVLKGKYDAEVPRLSAALKAAEEARAKAEAALAEEKKKAAATPRVTEEEVKEFGKPLVDLQRKVAAEELAPFVAQIEEQKKLIEDLRAQLGQTAQVGQQLNTQSFYAALVAKVPDWEAVNVSKEFLEWLDGVDPLYGKARQLVLNEAVDSLDANRVAAFFTAFKEDVQSRAAPRTEALEAQVTPSAAPAAPVADPNAAKKVWTPAQITKFYDDVRRGKYTAEEAGRIELDIQAASREGRYRQR